jgi:hypothetical protein
VRELLEAIFPFPLMPGAVQNSDYKHGVVSDLINDSIRERTCVNPSDSACAMPHARRKRIPQNISKALLNRSDEARSQSRFAFIVPPRGVRNVLQYLRSKCQAKAHRFSFAASRS